MSREDNMKDLDTIEEMLPEESMTEQVKAAESLEIAEPQEISPESGLSATEEEIPSFKTGYKPIRTSTAVLSAACLILAALLLLTQFGVIGTIRKSGAGKSEWFATPEEAISFLVSNVRDSRLDVAASAFMTQENTPDTSFKLQILNAGSFYPMKQYSMPEQYAQYSMLLQSIGEGQTSSSLLHYVASILLEDQYTKNTPISTDPAVAEQEVSTIIATLNPSQLEGLSLVRVDVINPVYQNDAEFKAILKPRMEAYGIAEYIEYSALLKMNDNYFISFFAVASVNGKWKILGIYSDLMDFQYPMAVPMTEQAYLGFVDSGLG